MAPGVGPLGLKGTVYHSHCFSRLALSLAIWIKDGRKGGGGRGRSRLREQHVLNVDRLEESENYKWTKGELKMKSGRITQ
jgi:hypothetical protein